jgi:hypothetical protein
MPEVDLTALAQSLYERRHEAVMVSFEVRTMASGSSYHHNCHNNVDRWVQEHPKHTAVRGWFVNDINEPTNGWFPFCYFIAHSVVKDSTGQLIDITPNRASQPYPFIQHDGPETEFIAIVQAGHTQLTVTITPS